MIRLERIFPRSSRFASFAPVIVVAALFLFAIVGPALSGFDPNVSDFRHGQGPYGLPASPNAWHWLGTDSLYRDVLARLAHGARLSLLVGFSATALAMAIATFVGMISGLSYGTKWRLLDAVLMRIVDAGLAFPYLLLIMALASLLQRPGILTVILVLGVTGWLGAARLIREKTIRVRQQTFFLAARALGLSSWSIVRRHLFPHVASLVLVLASSSVSSMILAESVLGYLGIGIGPPTATWGRMLREGQTYFTADPRLVALPGGMILLAVMGFNLLGEAVRDVLDPSAQ